MLKLIAEKDLPRPDDIRDVPLDNLVSIFKLYLEMQILCDKEKGIGLSAVQVGVPWKMFIVKATKDNLPLIDKKGDYGCFINCEYQPTTDKNILSLEGCLSLRSQNGQPRLYQVERPKSIRVVGKQLKIDKQLRLEDFSTELGVEQNGVVFCHEIDHHHGVPISEIGREVILW